MGIQLAARRFLNGLTAGDAAPAGAPLQGADDDRDERLDDTRDCTNSPVLTSNIVLFFAEINCVHVVCNTMLLVPLHGLAINTAMLIFSVDCNTMLCVP